MIRFIRQFLGLDPNQNPTLLKRKEALVLDLLGAGEMFGLEIVEASNGVIGRTGLYVLMASMEKRGLVAARVIKEVITTTHEWMNEESDHEHTIERRLYRRGIPQAKVLKRLTSATDGNLDNDESPGDRRPEVE
jgi:hypothetical protein